MATPGRTLGRYELITRIGEGGMAEVYLARQRGPKAFEKLVVVKTVHPRLASKQALAEALLEEARIAAKVRHPHVVDIYDLGEEDGTYFIAMEYLEGESMTSIIRAQRSKGGQRLPPLRTAQVIADCAGGLHAAHELKSLAGEPLELVHQDVTPGNVFVLYTGQAKLLDFGVAKVRNTADADLVKGKAGYLAPELFERLRADRRSDVFALGIVMWESLTLRRLFGGSTDAEAFAKIRACDVPPPSSLADGVPPELDAVCLRALTKSRDERYQTARALQEDLNALLRGADRHDYEAMAGYMRSAFASQIAVRQQLLRELDAGGAVGAMTLEALTATFADASPPESPLPADERWAVAVAVADAGEPAPVEAAPSAGASPAAVADPPAKPPARRLAPLPPPRGRTAPLGPTKPPVPTVVPAVPTVPTVPQPPSSPPPEPLPAEAAIEAAPAPTPVAADDVPSSVADELIEPSGLIEVDDPPSAPLPRAPSTPPRAPSVEELSGELPIAPPPSRRVWIGAGIAALALTVAIVAVVGRGGDGERTATQPSTAPPELVTTRDPAVDAGPPPVDAGVIVDAALAVDAGAVARPGPDGPGPGSAVEPRKRDPARAAELSKEGLQRFVAGDTAGAIASFQAALREDPGQAAAQRGLGLAYERRGDKVRAARAFRAYLTLAPKAKDAGAIRAKLERL